MTKKNLKIRQTIFGVGIVCLLGLVIFIATNNYPVIIVDSGLITAKKLNENLVIAHRLNPGVSDGQIIGQIIKNIEEQGLSQPSASDFVTELKFETTGKKAEYRALLNNDFNNDQDLFWQYVVKPEVYDAQLRIKYNSDFTANKDAYNRAQNIITSLNNGAPFEDLAKSQSDDKVSGQLGGDLGFVKSGQILPELEQAVLNTKLGEPDQEIVVTRLGYMIIYPVATAQNDGEKVWHVKQILIQTSGFDNWLNSQLNGFFV